MGLFSKVMSNVRGALTKTRETLVHGLKSLVTGRALDEALIDDAQRMLLEADVGAAATARLIDAARADFRAGRLKDGADLLEHLKAGMKRMLARDDPRAGATGGTLLAVSAAGPTVYLVTGINGAGKTTSIAKLAHHLRRQNKTVMLGACDTFRAGAVRQLEVWGERLGVEVVKGSPGADPAAVAFDACKAAAARGVDVLVIDTAGRLQTQDPLMRQLTKIRSVIAKALPSGALHASNITPAPAAPHETLLVLDATTGQNALRQAEEFSNALKAEDQRTKFNVQRSNQGRGAGSPADPSRPTPDASPPAPGITGIILAKLDGTAKGGVVVAIRQATDIPVKFIGTGERAEDLAPFDPDAFVEAMFSE